MGVLTGDGTPYVLVDVELETDPEVTEPTVWLKMERTETWSSSST